LPSARLCESEQLVGAKTLCSALHVGRLILQIPGSNFWLLFFLDLVSDSRSPPFKVQRCSTRVFTSHGPLAACHLRLALFDFVGHTLHMKLSSVVPGTGREFPLSFVAISPLPVCRAAVRRRRQGLKSRLGNSLKVLSLFQCTGFFSPRTVLLRYVSRRKPSDVSSLSNFLPFLEFTRVPGHRRILNRSGFKRCT